MLIEKNIELRSEEVQEILTRVPNKFIRYGSGVIFILLCLILLLSFLIKYPDVISSNILITTQLPPEKLIARSSGKFQEILIADKQQVKENEVIAIIENTANYQDVFLLKKVTDSILIPYNSFPFEWFQQARFGDIENSYAQFYKDYLIWDAQNKLQPYRVEYIAQSNEKRELESRLQNTLAQKKINETELELQKKDFHRYEELYKKGVVFAQEFEKQRLMLLQTEKNYQSVLSAISNMQSSKNDLNKNNQATKINENKEIAILQRNVQQSFLALKKNIADWEMMYVFKSSISGTLNYMQYWSKQQFITSGEPIFSIIPNNSKDMVGKIKAEAFNTGKIKKFQKVQIRLNNYPDREFGILTGVVQNISLIPDNEGNILIDINFPNGLTTSYQKNIPFQQEMTGTANIITDDLRLIERILFQFRDIFKRN
ncbi:MAG: HlyD family secretion protein [Flavobacterium sp.]